MMPSQTELVSLQEVEVRKWVDGRLVARTDTVAVEEPLALQLGFGPADARQRHTAIVTMRTPGQDAELALGWLYAEGFIQDGQDVLSVRHGSSTPSVVVVELHPRVAVELGNRQRYGVSHSSCGWCGQTELEQFARQCEPLPPGSVVPARVIHQLPEILEQAQRGFQLTGGLHAAALVTPQGECVFHAEDVGRHNALDKLVGRLIQTGLIGRANFAIVFMSSRASLELVQKTARARVPILATVGAPTSSAVRYADELGLTLIGFVRESRFNVYTNPERITLEAGTA